MCLHTYNKIGVNTVHSAVVFMGDVFPAFLVFSVSAVCMVQLDLLTVTLTILGEEHKSVMKLLILRLSPFLFYFISLMRCCLMPKRHSVYKPQHNLPRSTLPLFFVSLNRFSNVVFEHQSPLVLLHRENRITIQTEFCSSNRLADWPAITVKICVQSVTEPHRRYSCEDIAITPTIMSAVTGLLISLYRIIWNVSISL
jgi:hypothetical protein